MTDQIQFPTLNRASISLTVRDIAGETVMGMRVVAWMWEESTELANPSSQTTDRFATHWSTGPDHAERLFRESEVLALVKGAPSMHAALKSIADESIFNQMRFGEDTDADYFLRCFKAVKDVARAALAQAEAVAK